MTAISSRSVERDAGLVEGVVDRGADQLQVMARGDLGHDAAEAVVDPLGGDDVGRISPSAVITAAQVSSQLVSRARIIAAPGAETSSAVRHMITASSPVSR